MTHTIDLEPDMEDQLRAEAARQGQAPSDYLKTIVEEELRVARKADPAYLLTLPQEEQDRILAAQAAKAAPLYEADLALSVEQRELTAFTALDGASEEQP